MLRLALVALLVTSACRHSLDDNDDSSDGDGARACMPADTASCNAADSNQTLAWIEPNIFEPNCGGASCHGMPAGGGNPFGRIILTTGSHSKLVNVPATFATGRTLVVPGNVAQSYLMVILKHTALEDADPAPAPAPSGDRYMPLGSPPICCQKLDAIARWIEAGAPM